MRKRIFIIILSIFMCASIIDTNSFSYKVKAEESFDDQSQIYEYFFDDDNVQNEDDTDNNKLLDHYIEQIFSPVDNNEKKRGKQYNGSKLVGLDAYYYDLLSSFICDVANGNETSTIYSIGADELGIDKTTYTARDLGVNSVVVDGAINPDAITALRGMISYDLNLVINCLLLDYPYELYWYDKTTGVSVSNPGITATYNGTEYVLSFSSGRTWKFAVSNEYMGNEQYTVNSTGEIITEAVDNANSIVENCTVYSDYEKLRKYRDEICSLVDYNNEAVNNNADYGNPWQLVWVFDNDPETKVVCEGYSKAFQYLCDKTTFNDDHINCHTVSGVMTGGTGAGNHMWNLVTMDDGYNYLADITNCDNGTVGADYELFLVGISEDDSEGSVDNGYTFYPNGSSIKYTYSDNTRKVYSDEDLTVAKGKYEVPEHVDPTSGNAYAVLTGEGDLIFFRSYSEYENGTQGTIEDIHGNKYTGTVYAGVEDTGDAIPPWYSDAELIERVYVAEDTVIKPITMTSWFIECKNLESFNGTGFDACNLKSVSSTFFGCEALVRLDLGFLQNSVLTNMSGMLVDCVHLLSVSFPVMNTSKVIDFSSLFSNCVLLETIDVSLFNTESAIYMQDMFSHCETIKQLNLDSFDTSKVVNMSGMFCGCYSLENLYLSSFDTVNVIDMSYMFSMCSSLKTIDVSSFDTRRVENMSYMFATCDKLNSLDLSSFHTENVKDISGMFRWCRSLSSLNLANFNTSSLNDYRKYEYLYDMTDLKEIIWGKLFTVWGDYTRLPRGPWTNGNITKTADELSNEYMINAEQWAGRWYLADLNQAYYSGTSLNLDGIISMNFYFKVPEEYEDAYAELTDEMGNKTVVDLSTVPYSESLGYKVTYPNIVAKRMMMKISLRVHDKEGNVIPMERRGSLLPNGTFSYCVTDYVNDVLMTATRAYSKDLAYAILNYGQSAQEYFGYETDKPMPNPLGYLSEEMAAVAADPQYDQVGPQWDQCVGASLDLEGAISNYLYFKVPVTATLVSSNGSETALPVVAKSGNYRVEIRNIAAKRIHEMYTIRVKYEGKTYEYSTGVLSYVNRVLIPNTAANKSNLGKAFYLYNKAARLYFNY